MSRVRLAQFLKTGGKCPGCFGTLFKNRRKMSGVSLYQFLSRRILYAGGYYMLENFVLGGKRLGELNKYAG